MNFIQFLEQIGIAYAVGALAFGGFMWVTLEGTELTQEDGQPMAKKYFIITALVWPYSLYLLIKELNNGTS
jgi:TRAP-type C4-dicarboxylate transport system permease small subunit